MSWRTVVISQSAKLDYSMGFMVVRQADVSKINIDEIKQTFDKIMFTINNQIFAIYKLEDDFYKPLKVWVKDL